MSLVSSPLYLGDIQVGAEWESPARVVTQADVAQFAGLSGDFNPIHLDPEFAKTTPFRRPIAHGLLVLSIGSGLCMQAPPVRTLAALEIRQWHFKAPVFFGDTIRVRSTVLEKEVRARGRLGVVAWQRQIVNQEGKVVQEGVTVTLVEGRGSPEPAANGSRGGSEAAVAARG